MNLFRLVVAVALVVTAGAIVVVRTGPDESVSVSARARAVENAATIAAFRTDDASGWTIAPNLIGGRAGQIHLLVDLRADRGDPIAGASVEAEVSHLASGATVVFALVETAPGTYEVDLPDRGAGAYRVAVRARRGADHFAAVATVELVATR